MRLIRPSRNATPAPALGAPTALLALLLTAACGGGEPAPVAAPSGDVVTPPAPLPCDAPAGLALPAGWPASVPMPPGYVVTRTERRSGDRLIVSARVPGDFHRVVTFFNAALPAAGMPQSNGQLDPFDSESDFAGRGVQGRWTVGLSAQCDGASDLTMLVLPAPAPTAPAS